MQIVMVEKEHSDDILHYGVMGMRWGHRKATNLSNKANTAKRKAKELMDVDKSKAAKYKTKAKKYDARAKKIKDTHVSLAGSKEAYDYTVNESRGKMFVKSALFGTYGALKYNQARAKDISRGRAAVVGFISDTFNDTSGGWVSILEPRINATGKRKK